MAKYITKAQALSAMRKATNCTWDDIWNTEYVLNSVPTADVAPVVHAQWEVMRDPYGEIEGFLCSCGHESLSASNYCPECGARMDGENEK